YSILSNLGFIAPEDGFTTLEVSKKLSFVQAIEKFPQLADYKLITSSDAHHLWDIYEQEMTVALADKKIGTLLEWLRVS
ncbi:MAG: histidinol phosphatase, partial [Hyphomonadaceae bacterium]|nr:histidinol phosphatase [Clostridia bacterium]